MSKEIDISAIKEGDTVLVEHVVGGIDADNIFIEDEEGREACFLNTQIKQHTPKAFDWAEVKQMDAFVDRGDTVYYFLCVDPTDSACVITSIRSSSSSDDDITIEHKSYLTRAPEHDVKPPE